MKNIFVIIFLGISFGMKAQTELVQQTGIEASILSLSVNHQQPLTKSLLADISLGYSSRFYSGYNGVSFYVAEFSPFTRVEFKQFYNRKKRLNKGKNLDFNHGNFIGIQNKLVFVDKYHLTMLNEFHWGVQTQLADNFLLNFHIGVGHYKNLKNADDNGNFFPTVGLNFRYILF